MIGIQYVIQYVNQALKYNTFFLKQIFDFNICIL